MRVSVYLRVRHGRAARAKRPFVGRKVVGVGGGGGRERDGDFGLTMDGNGGMNFLLLD